MKFFEIKEFVYYAFIRGGWAPILVFVFHVIASKGFDAYEHFPLLDVPMHFIGGLAICYFFAICTKAPHTSLLLGQHTKFSLFVMLVALTGTTTVVWEFAEWISDQYFSQNAQLGVSDTMLDMFLGLLGGVIVAFIFAIKHKTN